uniref:Uncharacterized protein n=1 Tax=Arundo donax TaxID=35708 RepID=A0A0A8Z6H1_ARUDO
MPLKKKEGNLLSVLPSLFLLGTSSREEKMLLQRNNYKKVWPLVYWSELVNGETTEDNEDSYLNDDGKSMALVVYEEK